MNVLAMKCLEVPLIYGVLARNSLVATISMHIDMPSPPTSLLLKKILKLDFHVPNRKQPNSKPNSKFAKRRTPQAHRSRVLIATHRWKSRKSTPRIDLHCSFTDAWWMPRIYMLVGTCKTLWPCVYWRVEINNNSSKYVVQWVYVIMNRP